MEPSMQAKRAEARRERILDGARAVILRTGLRGATMEEIARESGIAKATLYSYYPDKDAIFAAIVETVARTKGAAFFSAMEQSGPLDEKVGHALAGKLGVVADILAGSPHADELLNEHHRLGGALKDVDAAAEAALRETLAAEGIDRPEMTTRMLLAAAYGITVKLQDPDAVREAIRLLAARVLGPARNT